MKVQKSNLALKRETGIFLTDSASATFQPCRRGALIGPNLYRPSYREVNVTLCTWEIINDLFQSTGFDLAAFSCLPCFCFIQ